MFIFEKVGHSKLVEMHGDTSDFFRSASKSDQYFFLLIAIYLIVICIVVVYQSYCYLYMPSWGPDLVNKLISIFYSIELLLTDLCLR